MADTLGTTREAVLERSARALGWPWLAGLPLALRAAITREWDERRVFLWIPVAFGAGVVLYFVADREPSLWLTALLAALCAALAWRARDHRVALVVLVGGAALFGGMASAGWRAARLAAPVLDRLRIVDLEGYVEELDHRREGARFVLRVFASDGLEPAATPYRVRLTTRRSPAFEAGAYVSLKARLLPPSRAAEPGGYDFARDAWFARIGAVGSVLGSADLAEPPEPPDLWLSASMAIDRARNALARRVDATVGGDAGAIAAAMVTGKRDLLSEDAKALIREAGIFHVITISGVQMTLVAGLVFATLRFLFASSRTLALNYPIKKWAAAVAMLAALAYDVMTGSRIGTERALLMTLIMLGAVLCDRQALTMRNLALAALAVLLLEPEAVLGASFQLSFAAVGALVAVHEARAARITRAMEEGAGPLQGRRHSRGLGSALFATLCATSATASFMASDFHELNPYVLIGNPLTLAIIEIFAVPGALLGTILYPLGLDALVWHYVGLGIALVMQAARLIGGLPGSTIHLPAFAPWAVASLAMAVLSIIIWRSWLLRATAVPFLILGLTGTAAGPVFDVAVAPLGEAVALRQADGRLAVIGRRPSAFATEQWLRADADGRAAKAVVKPEACDATGCIGHLAGGRVIALVLEPAAFAEDCQRAAILVTPLLAPVGCAAPYVVDRDSLRRTGALTFRLEHDGTIMQRAARSPDEDRPWSPAVSSRLSPHVTHDDRALDED